MMDTKRYYFNCCVKEVYTAWIDVPKEIANVNEAWEYAKQHRDEIEVAVDAKVSDAGYDFSWSELVDE